MPGHADPLGAAGTFLPIRSGSAIVVGRLPTSIGIRFVREGDHPLEPAVKTSLKIGRAARSCSRQAINCWPPFCVLALLLALLLLAGLLPAAGALRANFLRRRLPPLVALSPRMVDAFRWSG